MGGASRATSLALAAFFLADAAFACPACHGRLGSASNLNGAILVLLAAAALAVGLLVRAVVGFRGDEP